MQIFGHFCLLLIQRALCSVIDFCKKILEYSFPFFLMDCITCFKHLNMKADFGFGFLLFGSLGQVLKVLGLLFLFGIGLRFLQISWHCIGFSGLLCDFGGKSGGLGKGLCAKSDLDVKYGSKFASCWRKSLKLSKSFDEPLIETLEGTKNTAIIVNSGCSRGDDVDDNAKTTADAECNESGTDNDKDREQEWCEEDEEFDVLTLRRLVRTERCRADKARLELEKERMAAASAAEEAMSMILRLQNERSLVEMEAKQYRRLAEEKQLHDQEVIQSLQWLLLKHESERSVLEDQLKSYRKMLRLSMQSDEGDHSTVSTGVEGSWSSANASFEDEINPGLFASLDVNSSPCFAGVR